MGQHYTSTDYSVIFPRNQQHEAYPKYGPSGPCHSGTQWSFAASLFPFQNFMRSFADLPLRQRRKNG
jgi:hypothetical protein